VAEGLPGRNPPRESASIPLTLVVPPNAGPGEDYMILTAGGPPSTSGSASGSPAPRECVAAGYKPVPGTSPLVFLWLIVPVVIIFGVFWVWRRLAGRL
jgi:hypothetical protein